MNEGTVIILNGTSSSGKTSIIRALQEMLEEPYLEAGIDKFIWMLPERYLDRPLWDDVLGHANKAGDTGLRLARGMHSAIEALSKAGLNVIADHVLVEPEWWRDCAERFSRIPAYLAGIKCPLDVLEQREKDRRNRTLGQARAQYGLIHGQDIYDIEVDTSKSSPEECARLIKARIFSGHAPEAFNKILRSS